MELLSREYCFVYMNYERDFRRVWGFWHIILHMESPGLLFCFLVVVLLSDPLHEGFTLVLSSPHEEFWVNDKVLLSS